MLMCVCFKEWKYVCKTLYGKTAQTFGMCEDLKRKKKNDAACLRLVPVKQASFLFFLSLRQNKRAELLRYSLGAVCKIIGLTVSKLTAVFGNPWEIFLFNCSIQLKTSEIWEDMKRKMIHPWSCCRGNRLNKRKFQLFWRLSNPGSCLNTSC